MISRVTRYLHEEQQADGDALAQRLVQYYQTNTQARTRVQARTPQRDILRCYLAIDGARRDVMRKHLFKCKIKWQGSARVSAHVSRRPSAVQECSTGVLYLQHGRW